MATERSWNSHPVEKTMRPRPLVAILCSRAWGVRNVVHSGLLTELQRRGLRTCIIAARYPGCEPRQDWGDEVDRVELLRAQVIGSERGRPFLNAVLHASFSRRYGVNFRRIVSRWGRRNDGAWLGVRHVVVEALSVLGGLEPFYSWQVRYRDRWVRRSQDIGPVLLQLRRLEPSLVVSTNAQFSDELPYLFAAHDLGIPTLGCIQSFDNLTTRGVLPVFDYYAVWNQRMMDQVLRFHADRDRRAIHVTGTPQFDFHVRPEWRWSRDVTLQRLGLRSDDRYIVYAPSGLPTEPMLLAALSERCSQAPGLERHRIVVRPHPVDEPDRWERAVAHDDRLMLSWPWKRVPGVPWDAPDLVRAEDQSHLVSTLLHADACLSTASTIALDAAALTHYRPIMDSGGVRLTHDLAELVSETLAYVRDRARDDLERKRLVASECGLVDGRSGARVANLIADLCWGRAVTTASERTYARMARAEQGVGHG
ncbi:MAG: hypothetical protein E6J20_01145 [Chloroflexi bacterium]|nr:MAG: hypothetical protein E6J20_01145 [Chloroflexota bacterium]